MACYPVHRGIFLLLKAFFTLDGEDRRKCWVTLRQGDFFQRKSGSRDACRGQEAVLRMAQEGLKAAQAAGAACDWVKGMTSGWVINAR